MVVKTAIAVFEILKTAWEGMRILKGAREILSGESLSPGDVREFIERAVTAAETIAQAATKAADAHTHLAESAEQFLGYLGVATTWVNQAIALLSKILDEAEMRGIGGIDDIRKRMPKPFDD